MKQIAAGNWGRLAAAMVAAVWLCAAASAAGSSPAPAAPAVAATAAAPAPPGAKPETSFMDAPEGAAETAGVAVPNVGATLARLVGALALIGALLLGGLILFKRFAGRALKLARGGAEKPLRVVERVSLGGKSHICLLNACGRYLVVGVTEKEINVLTEVTLPGDESAAKEFAALLAGAPEKRSAN